VRKLGLYSVFIGLGIMAVGAVAAIVTWNNPSPLAGAALLIGVLWTMAAGRRSIGMRSRLP
jgi:hypothetical protein